MKSQSFTIKDARTHSINRSKLYEWLLDNDCPWEWETYDYADEAGGTCTLTFFDKEDKNITTYPEPDGDPSY